MTRYVDDASDSDSSEISHPSFGMIDISRRSGGSGSLFGVDYPQGHSIALTISTARLCEDGSSEYLYPDKSLIEIEMSEVQFARMITNPNSSGTPVTIRRTWGPDGKYTVVENPPTRVANAERAKSKIKDTARKVGGNIDHVLNSLEGFANGKAPTKKELRELTEWLQQAKQGIESDLPYYVELAEEKISDAVTNGKIEFDAYVQNSLAELGRKTVQERLAAGEAVPFRLAAPKVPEGGDQ